MASKKSCQFCQLDFKSRAFGLQHPQSIFESIHLPTENQNVNDVDESEENLQDGNDDQKSKEDQDIDDTILKYKATHVPGSFVCDYCTKVFKRKDLLKDHIFIHIIGKENFKCNMCNNKYYIKRNLNTHRRLEHT